MKRFTMLLTMLLIASVTSLPLNAAKKVRQAASAPSTPTVTVSCAVCSVGSPITISASGFAEGSAVLSLTGPATTLALVAVDNSGSYSVTFTPTAGWIRGNYLVTFSQNNTSASTSFELL
jgi:hypothetical protein